MEFRRDIEGLRALAIVLVVAAHAGAPGLSGGFIGVDVFFVLSGFLITGVLLAEYQASHQIHLWTFYAKRFRRLLPALLVMLLGAGAMGFLLLPHHVKGDAAHTGLLAALWLSNLHFAFAEVDYFGADTGLNLFLHTWSLGVEEQFYLVWPALMLVLFGLARARQSAKLGAASYGLGLVAMISLAACLWLTPTHPMWAYYLMPTRAWQFAAGALVYVLVAQGQLRHIRFVRPALLASCGMAGILLTLLVVRPESAYPGMTALLPTASVMLVLAAGSNGIQGSTLRLLASAPMQYLGRVSYSWYLWHWPVLVIGVHGLGMDSAAGRMQLVAVSLGLAHLSLALVESPVRKAAILLRQPRATALGSVMIMLLVSAAFWHVSYPIAGNGNARHDDALARTRSDMPSIYAMGCDDYYRSDRLVPCIFDPPTDADNAPVAVIAGDSIGLHWFPAVEEILVRREGWRLVAVTKSACPMVDHPIFNKRIGRMYTECDRWKQHLVDYVRDLRPDVLILGSSGGYGLSPQEWTEGTRSFLAKVAPYTAHTTILGPTPRLSAGADRCVREHVQGNFERQPECDSPALSDAHEAILDALVHAASTVPNVRVLPMQEVVCPTGTCSAVMNDRRAYRDNQHLTASFVGALADRVHELLRLEIEQGHPSP